MDAYLQWLQARWVEEYYGSVYVLNNEDQGTRVVEYLGGFTFLQHYVSKQV